MNLLLDTNVLTQLCYPAREENRPVGEWLSTLLMQRQDELTVCLPEIADYEARRGLLHVALRSGRPMTRSLERLDQLGARLTFLPITSSILRTAARLWAESRHAGRPTAGAEALDGDVILAAQALDAFGVVVTENVRHFSHVVTACRWHELSLS